MKNHQKISILYTVSIGLLFLFTSMTVLVGGTTTPTSHQITIQHTTDGIPYQGHLRIYVTEPVSRWNMYNQSPYHFGSLGLAYDDDLSLDYQDTFSQSITWDGDVQENNVMVMAAVYNPEPQGAYAYPPSKNPFEAHDVDAAAAATPGQTSYNTVNQNFTHTVFVEEGTATWCPYCPAMASALHGIYESGDYPFYYVALIDDKSPGASERLRTDYNIYGFPSAFFDGGYRVYVGGDANQNQYRTRIKSCGQRDVHEMNLTLSVEYIDSGDLKINVSIKNNEEILIPIIEIGNVAGGMSGVTATVRNVGSADASNISWSITVKGGFLKLTNITDTGAIDIPVGNQVEIKTTSRIFGLGKLEITVTTGEATKTFSGFAVGPFVIMT